MEHEHKLLRDEVAAVRMRTKAFALERARSLAAAGERRGELGRREEAAAAHDHRVAELERKIARMRGTMSPENRWAGGNRGRPVMQCQNLNQNVGPLSQELFRELMHPWHSTMKAHNQAET